MFKRACNLTLPLTLYLRYSFFPRSILLQNGLSRTSIKKCSKPYFHTLKTSNKPFWAESCSIQFSETCSIPRWPTGMQSPRWTKIKSGRFRLLYKIRAPIREPIWCMQQIGGEEELIEEEETWGKRRKRRKSVNGQTRGLKFFWVRHFDLLVTSEDIMKGQFDVKLKQTWNCDSTIKLKHSQLSRHPVDCEEYLWLKNGDIKIFLD